MLTLFLLGGCVAQMPLVAEEPPPPVVIVAPLLPQTTPEPEKPVVPAPAPDRWLFMKALQGTYPGALLDDNRMAVSGWTDFSFTASSDVHNQLPMGFNFLANQFLLQQNWLRFERTIVTTGTTEPTFGFRFDTILPGSDYRFTLPRGIFNGQLTADHGQPALYGIDPIQFYAEAYIPTVGHGLDVKLGRILGPFGVEASDAESNALASHSYTFIYDPFTHTGIIGTLKLTEAWTVDAGMMLGSDIFIDPADNPTGTGGFKWAPPAGRDSVLFYFILGNGRFDQRHNFNNPEIFDLVYTHEIDERLSYELETLLGFQTNVPGIGTATWFGAVSYLTYEMSPRLNATTRVEFFDDCQGQRTGFEGLYTTFTAGLAFKPIKDIWLRPEVRYDYNGDSRPFENKHGLFTADFDVLLRW
jgi:hypothetical protein